MYKPNSTVPDRGAQPTEFVEELSFPKACMRVGDYQCRVEAQAEAWGRSTALFNNATKQDRYVEMRNGITRGKGPNEQKAR